MLSTKFCRMIFFIFIALTICSQSFSEEKEINEEITHKGYIEEFYNAFGKQMEKKFNLKWIEKGILHNFSSNGIEFYAYRRATLDEARALELSMLDELARAIQEDPKMLSIAPESIGIDISFVYLQNWKYDDGSINNVYSTYIKRNKNESQKSNLKYITTDPFDDYSVRKDEGTFSSHFEESFEEAVKLNALASNVNPAIHEGTSFEDELNKILASFAKKMKERHSLRIKSIGWMIAGKATPDITEIRIKCMHLYSVDCQEARALILLVAEKLLTILNNNKTLRPFLNEHPFPASRLKLRMLFRKSKYFAGDVPYYDGSMESAVLSENMITYYHHTLKAHNRVAYAKESYQEAQKIFENASSPIMFEKVAKWVKIFILNFIDCVELIFILFFCVPVIVIANIWVLIIPIIIIGFIFLMCWKPKIENQNSG